MKHMISIISDTTSWINNYIPDLITALEQMRCSVTWIHDVGMVYDNDIAFFLGCGQMIPVEILKLNKHNLIVHESSLPQGRGWSPLSWQILEGKNEITVSLFEAEEKVDSGRIYLQEVIKFEGHELVEELREAQAKASIKMCLDFVRRYPAILKKGIEQIGQASYYPKRTPKDSQLDLNQPLLDQFNLLRIVDNDNYPAFFKLFGKTYIMRIEKFDSEESI